MFLSVAELAQMRADVANMLPDSAVIYGANAVYDGAGGVTETSTAVTGGTVACRVDPIKSKGSNVVIDPAREGLDFEYMITMPYDAPIAANRTIVTGGNTYEVVGLAREHSWNVSRRALVNRVG
jgi:hypothetical protein